MKVILYNPSSFGGNFDYSIQIATAYENNDSVDRCVVLYPVNAPLAASNLNLKKLRSDQSRYQSKWLKRFYFLYRTFINPLILFKFILDYPGAYIVFNDYDQLSSFFWVPIFKLFRKGYVFAVILHDPDRDHYLSSTWLSRLSMQYVMKLMHVGFYHEILPEKTYYKNSNTNYINIPHGIYTTGKPDELLRQELGSQLAGKRVVSIIGNIRKEKNYELCIEALKGTSICLLVAGKPANSGVPILSYQEKARQLGVEVVWITRYLNETELATVITMSDCILLYYSRSFTSQSGVLNVIAPYKKDVIISDTPSALARVAKQFGIGRLVPADDSQALRKALLEKAPGESSGSWKLYLEYASWSTNADIVIKALKHAKQN